MNHPQTIARVFGVLYLITFATSIPALFFFYAPVLEDPRYILGAGADTSVALGALLELILIIANIGTAVVLYPFVKRVSEILALGSTAMVVGFSGTLLTLFGPNTRPSQPTLNSAATKLCSGFGYMYL